MAATKTQVGIVGAGPAGLVLSHLLARLGIDNIVLEDRDRAYVENRVRAGVLEQGTVDLLHDIGAGERLAHEGLVHHGIYLQFDGQRHHIPMSELTGGRAITIYGQQEVVKDLIRTRLEGGGQILFEAQDVAVHGIESEKPSVTFRHGGEEHTLECDFVAGCDGFHGVCRSAIPTGALRLYERVYPFGWLGILAHVAPSSEELVYSRHPRGFALLSMRSPQVSRLYLQCEPAEKIEEWPDKRIWEELRTRLEPGDGWTLREGPIFEKGVTAMRSFVAEPMQYGRLFLAGDAAHVVPATGAKGLNLAVADVRVLADAPAAWYAEGRCDLLEAYSATCLRRVWRAQHFSYWMTSLLHRLSDDPFQQLQLSELRYVTTSRAAAGVLAENYVGLAEV